MYLAVSLRSTSGDIAHTPSRPDGTLVPASPTILRARLPPIKKLATKTPGRRRDLKAPLLRRASRPRALSGRVSGLGAPYHHSCVGLSVPCSYRPGTPAWRCPVHRRRRRNPLGREPEEGWDAKCDPLARGSGLEASPPTPLRTGTPPLLGVHAERTSRNAAARPSQRWSGHVLL